MRELDAEVAEKVMGFKRHAQPADYYGKHKGEPVLVPQYINFATWQFPPKGKIELTYFVPPYSTDIAAAWLVVEKIRDQLFSRRERFSTELNRIVSLRILKFTRIDPSQLILFVQPEDICRAALEAMK